VRPRSLLSGGHLTRAVLTSLALGLFSLPSIAASSPQDRLPTDINACLKMAEEQAAGALDYADYWLNAQRGGDEAKICKSKALYKLQRYGEAAALYAELAPKIAHSNAEQGAKMYAGAAWSYARSGDYGRAEAMYNAALLLRPGDTDLILDRAFARSGDERYWDSVADLTGLINKLPPSDKRLLVAYLYRASAWRGLASDAAALSDVNKVLAAAPDNPEALLLRGTIKMQGGILRAAMEDWRHAATVDKDGPAGRAALAAMAKALKAEDAAATEADATTDQTATPAAPAAPTAPNAADAPDPSPSPAP
jgi:tetratricopeptide (TPR) repeat protein